jgi:cell division septation protein DedD
LDTALRNRLTGAVILVLIAVLLLPELLTGAGRAAGTPPSKADDPAVPGASLTTLQIDLSGQTRDPATAAPAAESPSTVRLPVPEASRPPAQTPPAQPPPAQTSPPVDPAPLPAAPPPDAIRYFVQVGTFTTRERAEVARADLQRRGFEVTLNETTSGTRRLHRVRVGPVADRSAAEALELRLRPIVTDRAIVAVPATP